MHSARIPLSSRLWPFPLRSIVLPPIRTLTPEALLLKLTYAFHFTPLWETRHLRPWSSQQSSQRHDKVVGGIRVDEGIERVISGWLDHNLAAQAVAEVDDDLLLRTRLHGISLLRDLRHGSLHGCIRLPLRRIDVRP